MDDTEVRTLPPLAMGLGPGTTTVLPHSRVRSQEARSRPTETLDTQLTSKDTAGAYMVKDPPYRPTRMEALQARARKHAYVQQRSRKEILKQNLGDLSRAPLDDTLARTIALQDASVSDMLTMGIIRKDTDLTSALQHGTAMVLNSAGQQDFHNDFGHTQRVAKTKIAHANDRFGIKRAREKAKKRPEVLMAPLTVDVSALKLDTQPSSYQPTARQPPSGYRTGRAKNPAARAHTNTSKAATAAVTAVNLLDQVNPSGALKHPQTPPEPTPKGQGEQLEAGADNAELKEEADSLTGDLVKIRTYLELMDTFSLHHFIMFKGKTLSATPEFASFKRTYEKQWSDVERVIAEVERVMTRHNVEIAIIDGGVVAKIALATLDRISLGDVMACVENSDEVGPQVNAPIDGAHQFDVIPTRKQRIRRAAVRIQGVGRMYVAKRDFKVKLRRLRSAVCIQTFSRKVAACHRVKLLLERDRCQCAETWSTLQQRLRDEWAHMYQSQGTDSPYDSHDCLAVLPAGRVEIHMPSHSLHEQDRLFMQHTPIDQNFTLGGRLSRLRDPTLAHLVYVSPVMLPEDLEDYWVKLLELAGVEDVRERLTIVVPEFARELPPHWCLASMVMHSPIALRRLKHLAQAAAHVYLIPEVVGWQDKQLAVTIGVPLLAAPPTVAQLAYSHSGAKQVFQRARVNIPIGAHDLYDQEDVVIALTKLICGNLDIEEWHMCTDAGDDEHETYGDTCVLRAGELPVVHVLRSEREELMAMHGGDKAVWTSPDVQILARAKVLKQMRGVLPQIAVYPPGTQRKIGGFGADKMSKWQAFLRRFLRAGGVIEAQPPPTCKCGELTANLWIDPLGHTAVVNTQEVIATSNHEPGAQVQPGSGNPATACTNEFQSLAAGAAYPQRLVPERAIVQACEAIGRELGRRGVCGFTSVSFVVFRDAATNHLKVWGKQIRPFYTMHAAAHDVGALLACSSPPTAHGDGGGGGGGGAASSGASTTTASSSTVTGIVSLRHGATTVSSATMGGPSTIAGGPQQSHHPAQAHTPRHGGQRRERALRVPCYVSVQPTYHPKLPTFPFPSFFKLCRLNGVSFDLRYKTGIAFTPVDSLGTGIVGFTSLGRSLEDAAVGAHDIFTMIKRRVGTRTGSSIHRKGEDGNDGFDDFLQVADGVKDLKHRATRVKVGAGAEGVR